MSSDFRHSVAAWLQGTVSRAEFGVLLQDKPNVVRVLVLPQSKKARLSKEAKIAKLQGYKVRLQIRFGVVEMYDGEEPCLLVREK